MNANTIIEVIDNLLGHTDTIGETIYDHGSLHNVNQLDVIMDYLIDKLIKITWDKQRGETSRKQVGEQADTILYNIYMNLKDIYEEDNIECCDYRD